MKKAERSGDDVLLATTEERGGGDSIKAECRLSDTALALLLLALAVGVVDAVSATWSHPSPAEHTDTQHAGVTFR